MSIPDPGPSTLRALMTVDAVGGVWQYALDAAEGLKAHGVQTTLAVLGPAPSDDQALRAEAVGLNVIVTGLPLDWTAERREDVEAAGRAVARLASEIRPDVLHLNSPALAAGAGFGCPVVSVCHSCVATWWKAVRGGPLPEEFLWRTQLVQEGYRASDIILAPTAAFAKETAQVYDLASAPLVVRNGRSRSAIKQAASDEIFAFTAGRLWDDGKNFAAIDLAASQISIPVLAAGPLKGPNGAEVAARHAASLGRQSDGEIAAFLNAQPIFVSAARYEPFGLAVLEAAQAGCALVLSDIPTFRELWEGVAVFVNPEDDAAIAQAIDQLASNKAMRSALGARAKERSDSYSLDAMCAGILAAYRSLLPPRSNLFSLKGAAA